MQQAAALIFADIREQQYDREFYPTANEVAEDPLHFCHLHYVCSWNDW